MPLAPQVEKIAKEALFELLPVWLALPLIDYRRVLRPNGPGSYSIAIEPYRGSSTWITFSKYLQSSDVVQRLRAAIAEYQPELSGYLVTPGQSMHLGDSSALLTTWCRAMELAAGSSVDFGPIVHNLLCDVSDLLDSRLLTHRITTTISGLRLPTSDFSVQLADGLTLRAMSNDEISALSSRDITFGHENDVMFHSVSCCLVFETKSPFSLSVCPPTQMLASTADDEARRNTADVLRALHILKVGRAGVFQSATELTPNLLPWLAGGYSWPLYRPPFSSLEITAGDIEYFVAIFQALRAGVRDEVRIASDRLVDAEGRLSPVDSLMDAAIGLEVLLNPMDTAELAFRVALNYAYLAAPEIRRERYERVRAIQKTRNRVVHGGLNLQSPDAAEIQEHAGLAKACLRDSIKNFLLNETLSGNMKLDADFWLDRILPKNIVLGELTQPDRTNDLA